MFRKEIINDNNIWCVLRWPLVIGLLIRLGWLILAVLANNYEGFLQYDSEIYMHIANVFSESGNMAYQSIEGEFYPIHNRVPGFPFLISIFGIVGVITLQFLAYISTLILIAKFVEKINPKAIVFSLWIYAIDIPSVIFTSSIMTETLFTFGILLSVHLMLNYSKIRHAILVGVIIGLIAFLRPITLFLPIILIVGLFTKSYNLKFYLITLFSFVIVISPWIIRNYMEFGKPVFSTVSATNLHQYRASGIVAEKTSVNLYSAQAEMKNELKNTDPMSFVAEQKEAAIDTILDNKLLFLKQSAFGGFRMLFYPMRAPIDYQLGWNNQNSTTFSQYSIRKTSGFTFVLVIWQLILAIVLWVGVLFFYLKKTCRPSSLKIVLIIIAYFVILSSGAEADARFRIPIIPFLAILSGLGLSELRLSRYIRKPELNKKYVRR